MDPGASREDTEALSQLWEAVKNAVSRLCLLDEVSVTDYDISRRPMRAGWLVIAVCCNCAKYPNFGALLVCRRLSLGLPCFFAYIMKYFFNKKALLQLRGGGPECAQS